jgi:ribosomal protein L11 methyltransferase
VPAIRSRALDEEDWAEDWKQHFRPTAVGQRFFICPPWDTSGANGRINLVIHPGMAFGTGQHPTTRGCLELIEEATAASAVARALDVGTGSGILSIALAKLGAAHVAAVDNDPQACTIAAENSVLNGTEAIILVTHDWQAITGGFDLIVANLFTNLLCDLSEQLQSLLNPRGRMVCSGFLTSDEASIIAAYPRLAVVRRKVEEDWVTLLLAADGYPD